MLLGPSLLKAHRLFDWLYRSDSIDVKQTSVWGGFLLGLPHRAATNVASAD